MNQEKTSDKGKEKNKNKVKQNQKKIEKLHMSGSLNTLLNAQPPNTLSFAFIN